MAKQLVSDPTYAVNDTFKVIDRNSPFLDKTGRVIRLGSAGDVIYIHGSLDGVQTIMAFRSFQIQKG